RGSSSLASRSPRPSALCRDAKSPALPLTDRAEECRAAHLDATLDGARTATPRTSLSLAIVNAKPIVASGPMTIRDGRSEHQSNGINQCLCSRTCCAARRHERRRAPLRRQPGQMQRFAHIDIAEARDDALIQKGRLETGLLTFQCLRESRGVESAIERFWPQSLQRRIAH